MNTEKLIAAVIVILILSMSTCTVITNNHDNQATIDLVEQGQSASSAACAIQRSSERTSALCVNALLEDKSK